MSRVPSASDIARRQRQSLEVLKVRALGLSLQWADVDEYFVGRMDDLHRLLGDLQADLAEVYPPRKAGKS